MGSPLKELCNEALSSSLGPSVPYPPSQGSYNLPEVDIVILLNNRRMQEGWGRMNEKRIHLGDLQQLTMLAVARLGKDAFGSAVQDELLRVSGRDVSVPTVYVTLVRLEDQGLVRSTNLRSDPNRGGRGKRIFEITPSGWEALETSRLALERMWEGVEPA